MKKIILFLIFQFSIFADSKNELLVVANMVVGKSFYQESGKDPKKPIKKGQIFTTNDIIITEKGKVDIQIGPSSIVRISEYTVVKLKEIAEKGKGGSVELNLTSGRVYAKVGKQPTDSKFKISSPTSVAGVRGTEFLVSENDADTNAEDDQIDSGVYVSDGEVNTDVKGKNYPVKAGEQILSTAENAKVELLNQFAKEKLQILKTLQVMKEENYKLLKEQKEKNNQLLGK